MPRLLQNPRRLRAVLIFLSLALLPIAVAVYAVHKFNASERTLAGYCQDARVGESLKDAKQAAERLGLVVTPDTTKDLEKPRISVGSDGSWWSAISFCSLTHDSARITGFSYNPWYH